MKLLVAVLATFSLAIGDSSVHVEPNITSEINSSEIIGGRPASLRVYPWQVQVLRNNDPVCSGVIIDQRPTILTSAQCVSVPHSTLSIRTSDNSNGNPERDAKVTTFVVHPLYKDCRNCFNYDIAIIHVDLRRSNPGAFFDTIPLWEDNHEFPPGITGEITGWDRLSSSHSMTFGFSKIDLSLVASTRCRAVYGPATICAGFSRGKGVCVGDAGSPLIIESKLAGILSFANECNRPGKSIVFTSVPAVRSWIRQNSDANRFFCNANALTIGLSLITSFFMNLVYTQNILVFM